MDGASGDELEANSDRPPRKKRYHQHTPRQIQELESSVLLRPLFLPLSLSQMADFFEFEFGNLIHAYLQTDLVHPELGLLSTMNNSNNNTYVVFVSSAYRKKAMHTLLASKLTQLHIPSAARIPPKILISPTCWPRRRAVSDLRLLALPGGPTGHTPELPLLRGPVPRFTLSKLLPEFDRDEHKLYYSSSNDTGSDYARDGAAGDGGRSVCHGDGVAENGRG
ncbi:hypothetical protein OROHE_026298 [Orobanche hederae]